MRCQDCEIQRTHQALSGKFGGAVIVMISEIGDEKERRCQYSRNLTIPVRLDAAETYEPETSDQQERAGRIESRVDVRKI